MVERASGRRSQPWWCAVLLVGGLLPGADARADVVDIPPECPNGSLGDGCHGAEFCKPLKCTTDMDCNDGAVCMDVQMCTDTRECSGGGTGGSSTQVQNVIGPCTLEGTCAMGMCNMLKLCVSPGDPTGGATGTTAGATGGSTAAATGGATGEPPGGSTGATGGTGGGKKGGCDGCDAGQAGPAGLLLALLAGLRRRRRA